MSANRTNPPVHGECDVLPVTPGTLSGCPGCILREHKLETAVAEILRLQALVAPEQRTVFRLG